MPDFFALGYSVSHITHNGKSHTLKIQHSLMVIHKNDTVLASVIFKK
jgi:hypothetical protein